MTSTPEDVVERARRCIGHGVAYVLGKGGFRSDTEFPWVTPEDGCDCSGFAMWCLGLPRQFGGIWYGTDQIVADAKGSSVLFHAVAFADARPGDLLVYPHPNPHQHGHVGVVVLCDQGKPSRVIHCSLGGWRNQKDAIQQTGAGLWLVVAKNAIAVRLNSFTEAGK